MAITSMSELWLKLDAFNKRPDGQEREVNQLNEWGGFSRKLGMPVFTAWQDHLEFDRETKLTKAVVSDTTWQGSVGLNNQERLLAEAEQQGEGIGAFFVIHAVNEEVHPRKIACIDSDKVFVGKIVRNGTETYILGKPQPL